MQISKLVETLQMQLTEKGQEIHTYMEKHNIQVRGGPKKEDGDMAAAITAQESSTSKSGTMGVLVSSAATEDK